MADKPTQKTQPKKKGAEPIDIPIPSRDQILGDLAKTAQPENPKRKKRAE